MPTNIDTMNGDEPTNQHVLMKNDGGDMESLDRANAGTADNESSDGRLKKQAKKADAWDDDDDDNDSIDGGINDGMNDEAYEGVKDDGADPYTSTAVDSTSKDGNTDNDDASAANGRGEKMMADDESSNADGINNAWQPSSLGDDNRSGGRSSNNYHSSFISESASSSVVTRQIRRNPKQDEFVKKSASARALLATALNAVADGFASNAALARMDGNADGNEEVEDGSVGKTGGEGTSRKNWNANTDFAHAQELAQKKTEECMGLKRKLEESKARIEILQTENTTSQQNNTQFKAKIDRTVEALSIAGANAANAKAEADASNARSESLSSQLNDLQSVIDETKRGMEVVRMEHDEVSRAARSVEGRLIQVESELTRAARDKKDAVEERDFFKARADKSEKLARTLQEKVDDYQDETRMLKKDLLEMEELEKARADRTNRIEAEFQEARSGLLEAASAAAEAESTVTSLRSVIEELRRENESLHDQMNANRDSLAKDRAKQNEALTIAEREAQKWKMKVEEADEEARKLKMDKAAAEKSVETLKVRCTNMERRLNDSSKQFSTRTEKTPAASSSITPHSSANATSNNLGFINTLGASTNVSEESNKRKFVAELPQRSKAPPSIPARHLTYSNHKENTKSSSLNKQQQEQPQLSQRSEALSYGGNTFIKKTKSRSKVCSLCNKEGGMTLSCQCGKVGCEKRAHAICIGKLRSGKDKSVGTILCGEVAA